jgi:hypothetical protein
VLEQVHDLLVGRAAAEGRERESSSERPDAARQAGEPPERDDTGGSPSADGGAAAPPEWWTSRRQPTAADGPPVAEALLAELRAGRVDDETVEALRTYVGDAPDTASAVRLDRLSARVEELETYTDALERILNRVGTDEDIVASLEALESDLAALDAATGGTDELRVELAAVGRRVESLRADQEATRGDLGDVREALDDARREFGGVSEELAVVRRDLEDLREWQRTLSSALVGDRPRPPASGNEP